MSSLQKGGSPSAWLLFVFFSDGIYVAPPGLELLGSRDPPAHGSSRRQESSGARASPPELGMA